MTVMHGIQLLLLLGVLALVIERVLAIAVHGPLDPEPFVRGLRSAPDPMKRRWIERGGRAFVARACAPYVLAEPAEREVAIEEALVDAKQAIVERLPWIRIGASLSTLGGFVGAAIPLGSLYYGDHGLAALDPARLQAAAMSQAALSIALGVGGSSFALACWLALRGLAKRLISECDRAADRLRAT